MMSHGRFHRNRMCCRCVLRRSHWIAWAKHLPTFTMALEIQTKEDLYASLASAGSKLVVVQYYAKWCGSCKAIFPHLQDMIRRYRDVLFLRVDIDEVQELTRYFHISSTPTFQFYIQEEKLDEFSGSKAEALENKIKELM